MDRTETDAFDESPSFQYIKHGLSIMTGGFRFRTAVVIAGAAEAEVRLILSRKSKSSMHQLAREAISDEPSPSLRP